VHRNDVVGVDLLHGCDGLADEFIRPSILSKESVSERLVESRHPFRAVLYEMATGKPPFVGGK
jgi:hypothetical protein